VIYEALILEAGVGDTDIDVFEGGGKGNSVGAIADGDVYSACGMSGGGASETEAVWGYDDVDAWRWGAGGVTKNDGDWGRVGVREHAASVEGDSVDRNGSRNAGGMIEG